MSKPYQFVLLFFVSAVVALTSVDAQERSRKSADTSKSRPASQSATSKSKQDDDLPNSTTTKPQLNQTVVDFYQGEWDGRVLQRSRPGYEKQMQALIQAYQQNDEKAWAALNEETGTRARQFSTERAAFFGGSMKFVGDIDGFETNAGVRIQCFHPVDAKGQRLGSDFHYIVSALSHMNSMNVTGIVESGTGELPTNDDLKGMIIFLSKKYSLRDGQDDAVGDKSGTKGKAKRGIPSTAPTKSEKSESDAARTSKSSDAKTPTTKTSPKSKEPKEGTLPKVNQSIIDNMKKYWDDLGLSVDQQQRLQAALDELLDAIRRKDFERCRRLMPGVGQDVNFETLHNALCGSNMFIYGEDGWKPHRDQPQVIYTYMPVDPRDPNTPTGPMGYIITHPVHVSASNPMGLSYSNVTTAREKSEVSQAILHLKKVQTTPSTKLKPQEGKAK